MSSKDIMERNRERLAITARIIAQLDKTRTSSSNLHQYIDTAYVAAKYAHNAAASRCAASDSTPVPSSSATTFSPCFDPFPRADDPTLLPGERAPSPYREPLPPMKKTEEQQEPEAVTPVNMASLAGLPNELKALIVEWVAVATLEEAEEDFVDEEEVEDDDEEEEPRKPAGKAKRQGRVVPDELYDGLAGWTDGLVRQSDAEDDASLWSSSPLNAIALVNKEFAALANPFLWRSVDLSDRLTTDVLYFLSDILPRHGHLVDELWLKNLPDDLPDEDMYNGSETVSPSSPWIVLREAANALILLLLPHVHIIDVDYVENPTKPVHSRPDPDAPRDGWAFRESLVNDILRLRGEDISDLSVDLSVSTADEGHLGTFLQTLPNLERLSIASWEDMLSTGRTTLIKSITSLQRLTTLSLDACQFIDEDFCTASWSSGLEVLALDDCEYLTLPLFFKLVERHAATLQVLDISDTPGEHGERQTKKYLGKPFPFALPKLDTFVLSTPHSSEILALVSKCPLQEVEIGWCPRISYEAWETFVTHHLRTLKRLTVQGGGNFSEAQKESLEVFCHAKGVDLTIEPDSDDEGSEEDEFDDGFVSDEDFVGDEEYQGNEDWDDDVYEQG